MEKYFYELEYRIFYKFDEIDKENVEDRFFIGIFSSAKKVSEVIKICMTYKGVLKNNFRIKRYRIKYLELPTTLYSSYHEYTILTSDENYIDYSYRFAPKATKEEAEKLCNLMRKTKKYKRQVERDYTTYPPDGFGIDEITIDQIYFHGLR